MDIHHFRIGIIWEKEDKTNDEGNYEAHIDINRNYHEAQIHIYPLVEGRWKTHGDDWLNSLIAHEMAHILTNQLHYLCTAVYKNEGEVFDAKEQLTERIARLSCKYDDMVQKKKV